MENQGSLLQQVALLRWLTSQTDEDRLALTAITGLQVGGRVLNLLTGQDQVDRYKADCIRSVSSFLNDNPGASQQEVNEEVKRSVLLFAARVQAMERSPLI